MSFWGSPATVFDWCASVRSKYLSIDQSLRHHQYYYTCEHLPSGVWECQWFSAVARSHHACFPKLTASGYSTEGKGTPASTSLCHSAHTQLSGHLYFPFASTAWVSRPCFGMAVRLYFEWHCPGYRMSSWSQTFQLFKVVGPLTCPQLQLACCHLGAKRTDLWWSNPHFEFYFALSSSVVSCSGRICNNSQGDAWTLFGFLSSSVCQQLITLLCSLTRYWLFYWWILWGLVRYRGCDQVGELPYPMLPSWFPISLTFESRSATAWSLSTSDRSTSLGRCLSRPRITTIETSSTWQHHQCPSTVWASVHHLQLSTTWSCSEVTRRVYLSAH